MSSKGKHMIESKGGKGSGQSRKNNRRRSQRHASLSNGDPDDSKERAGKRGRDSNKDSNDFSYDDFSQELYKSVIDLVPSTEYNCSPTENPAMPGTQVNLHGVILHETQGGLIVLNVRWRNQVYSGALIDVEKSKWAAERIPTEGNSEMNKFHPPPPIYNNAQPPIKKLRIPTSTLMQHAEDSDSGSSTSTKKKGTTSPTTPSKGGSKSRTNGGKKRGGGAQDSTSPVPEETQTTPKKTKLKILVNGSTVENNFAAFECLEPNCGKKYKNKNGLSYHQRHSHAKKVESFEEKDTKSDDSDSGDDNFVIDEKAGEDSSKEDDERDEEMRSPTPPLIPPQNEQEAKGESKPITEALHQLKQIPKEPPKLIVEEIKSEETVSLPDNIVVEIKEEPKPPVIKDDPTLPVKLTGQTHSLPPLAVEKIDPVIDEKHQSMAVPPVPAIHVERFGTTQEGVNSSDVKPPPPNIVVVKSEEEKQRSGSSKIIIHGDSVNSLNELFPPQQSFQYSPTLSSLNPQKLNQSMTEVLAKKQQTVNTVNTTVSSAPLMIARLDSIPLPVHGTAAISTVKASLSAKPSMEIKPTSFDLVHSQAKVMAFGQDMFKQPATAAVSPLSDGRPKAEEFVVASDEERSISPENMLTFVNQIFPQERQPDLAENKTSKPNMITSLGLTTAVSTFNVALRPTQGQKGFENTLLFKELAGKVSSEAANISLLSGGKFPANLVLDQKIPPQLLKSLHLGTADSKVPPSALGIPVGDLKAGLVNLARPVEEQPKPPASLLHQRLLLSQDSGSPAIPNKYGVSKANTTAAFLSSGNRPPQKLDAVASMPAEFRDKIAITTSLTLNTNRLPDKSKAGLMAPTGLRINPPPDERQLSTVMTSAWAPGTESSIKEAILSSSVAAPSFRNPLTKSISMTDMQLFATSSMGMMTTADSRPKMLLKRTTSTIPIAPAPSAPAMSNRPDLSAAGPVDYSTAESGDNRDHFTHRFTLTSDKRLVSSPAENRGRPKKIRVEKTQHIPIGTAQEMARSRGTPDSPVPRSRGATESPGARKVTSPVVRASVIQGSHPGVGPTSLADHISPKKPDIHMFQLPRSMNDHGSGTLMDERARFTQQVKMSSEARNLAIQHQDRHRDKNMKSPPSIYYSQQNPRRILSPPTSRTASISPRGATEVLSRSSPTGFPPEMIAGKPYLPFSVENRDKYAFSAANSAAAEHARSLNEQIRKQEIHRSVTEQGRPPMDNRKSVLSPREGGMMMQPSFGGRPSIHEQEYTAFSRHQSPRPEMAPRDMPPRAMYDHRGGHDESEQARLAATRDRYLMAPGLASQQTMYGVRNSSPPPPVPSVVPHSSNLVLGRADGSILSKIPYEPRTNEQKR